MSLFMEVKNMYGKPVDFMDALQLMDDGIIAELENEQRWTDDQAFYDAYCARHLQRFGEEFAPNRETCE